MIALEELKEQGALKDTKFYYYKKFIDEGTLDAKDFNDVLLSVSDTFPKNAPETHFSDPLLWVSFLKKIVTQFVVPLQAFQRPCANDIQRPCN